MRKVVKALLISLLCLSAICFIFGCKKQEIPQEVNNPYFIAEVVGGNNVICIKAEKDGGPEKIDAYFSDGGNFYKVDDELLSINDSEFKAEILGLKKGEYSVRIDVTFNGEKFEYLYENVEVGDIDRSGYAHFNFDSGVGAYNTDGTLKDNALVLYLTDDNKNTITTKISGKTCVGIVQILENLRYLNQPVAIRVVGSVETNQWKSKNLPPRLADNSNLVENYFDNEFETTVYENILGLKNVIHDAKDGLTYNYMVAKEGINFVNTTNYSKKGATKFYNKSEFPAVKGKLVYADDCSFNSVTIREAKNVTIEGVFDDARIYQWGVSFRDCNSIEVKNLTFDSYTEDAVGFYSSIPETQRVFPYGNYFITNCTFNSGRNNWDLTGERDKYKGDGSVDFNLISNATISYCQFLNCKKTNLISSNEECGTKNITLHHNYYYNCESRLPFTRHSNIHSYNNYFDSCNTCITAGANAYVFSENNYFYNCKKVAVVTSYFTYTGAAVKSFNDSLVNCNQDASTKVTARDSFVKNSCDVDKSVDYATFDTNPDIFYYDSVNKKSSVNILTDTDKVVDFVNKHSGINGRRYILHN